MSLTVPDTPDSPSSALDEWRAIEQAATKGPWKVDRSTGGGIRLGSDDLRLLAERFRRTADAEFAATARTATPRLVAAIEDVLKVADKWDVTADRLGTHHSRHQAFKMCAGEVREAITAALAGEEAGDGGS